MRVTYIDTLYNLSGGGIFGKRRIGSGTLVFWLESPTVRLSDDLCFWFRGSVDDMRLEQILAAKSYS